MDLKIKGIHFIKGDRKGGGIVIKIILEEEIEELRQQLTEEWKQSRLLSHPTIVQLSQTLDSKIMMYQQLTEQKSIARSKRKGRKQSRGRKE